MTIVPGNDGFNHTGGPALGNIMPYDQAALDAATGTGTEGAQEAAEGATEGPEEVAEEYGTLGIRQPVQLTPEEQEAAGDADAAREAAQAAYASFNPGVPDELNPLIDTIAGTLSVFSEEHQAQQIAGLPAEIQEAVRARLNQLDATQDTARRMALKIAALEAELPLKALEAEYRTKAQEEGKKAHHRKKLEAAGEVGYQFASMRATFDKLQNEGGRVQATVGRWSRKANLDGLGVREEDGHGMLYAGKVNTVFGPSEAGKSMFAFAIAAQEILAGNHVLILDFEDDQEGFVSRLVDLGVGIEQIEPDGAEPGGAWYMHARIDMDDDDFLRIRDVITKHSVSYVIVDSVTAAMGAAGLNPDKGADVAQWVGSMPGRFADLGPAVLVIDHTNLTDSDRAGGSGYKKGVISGVSYVAKKSEAFIIGRGGKASICIAKDRIGTVRQFSKPADKAGDPEYRGMFVMDSDRKGFSMIGLTQAECDYVPPPADGARPSAGERVNALVEEVVAIVRADPGISKNAVRERMESAASGTAKQAAIDEAERLGRVVVEKGPRRAQLLRVAEDVQEELPGA